MAEVRLAAAVKDRANVIRKFLWTLVTLAAILATVTLAVANRHPVQLILDPFRADNPAFFIDVPLFILLLASMIFGVLLGGLATWFSQAKWRRTARARTKESNRWRSEADRLSRERDLQHQSQLASSRSN